MIAPRSQMDRHDLAALALALAVIGFCLGVLAIMPSCSLFESACTKALPTLTTASVLLDDAQNKVDQAAAIVARIPDPAQRERALVIVAELRAGLDAASAALDAASTPCTAPDVATVFGAFITAWPKIAPFISLLGGPSGSQVQPPLVMRHAR